MIREKALYAHMIAKVCQSTLEYLESLKNFQSSETCLSENSDNSGTLASLVHFRVPQSVPELDGIFLMCRYAYETIARMLGERSWPALTSGVIGRRPIPE